MKRDFEDDNILLAAFIKHSRLVVNNIDSSDLEWARNEVHNILAQDPFKGLEIIIKVLKECDSKKLLAYVAAGPLEELLVSHGNKVIRELKAIADCDDKIQLAISGVWLDEEDEIFSEWEELMKKYGFIGKNPKKAL